MLVTGLLVVGCFHYWHIELYGVFI